MIQSYPLTFEGISCGSLDIVDIYSLGNKIAIPHFAFGPTTQEEYDKEKRTPSYALLDTFSMDFSERKQAHLLYTEQEIFSASDAVCYWENGRFLLNTRRYSGFSQTISKIMQITATNLVELGDAPAPIQMIYNDKKIYTFGNQEIKMVSHFRMECRDSVSQNVLWKLKLSAYLYTEVEEQNDILYFGTAGKGGRFYGVSLADGSVVFSLNTGGTVRFTWYKGWIIVADRKSKPVLLNPVDGVEMQRIEFGKFTFTVDQFMLVIGDRLYAVASCKNEIYAVCVDLPGV